MNQRPVENREAISMQAAPRQRPSFPTVPPDHSVLLVADDAHATIPAGIDGSASDDTRGFESPTTPDLGQHDPYSGALPAPGSETLGDYDLIQVLAQGGMGVVYKARQRRLNRVVAVKMILAGKLASAEMVQRFYTEAESAARLDHPGIVPIYEVGEVDGRHFFSMGYVEGESLAARIAAAPLPSREAAVILKKVAEAVEYAHRQGVLHRDLKPANILLDKSEHPKVTDFGLAKRTEDDQGLTQSGQILGTPGFMPPEQAAGQMDRIGPAADVYALGAVLYAMLTGRPPFQAASILETLKQVIEQEPAAPRQLNPAIDHDLETICLKCLQKSPERRYASAAELADDLARYLRNEPIRARRACCWERTIRWIWRKPAAAALVAVSIIAFSLLPILVSAVASLRAAQATAQAQRTQLDLVIKTAEAKETQLRAAREAAQAREALLKATQETAATHEYYSRVNRLRERSTTAPPGWTWDTLADLAHAAQLPSAKRELSALRSYAAAALRNFDLREKHIVARNIDSQALAFSPDGKVLAVCQSKAQGWIKCNVYLYNVETGEEVSTLSFLTFRVARSSDNAAGQEGIRAAAFSPDGHWFAVGTRTGMVHCWDWRQPAQTPKSWNVHRGSIHRVEFTPDSTAIISYTSGGREIKVWDLEAGIERAALNTPNDIDGLGLHPNGQTLAYSHDLQLGLLSVHDLRPQGDFWKWDGAHIDFHPSGQILAGYVNGRIEFVDISQQRVIRTIRDPKMGSSDDTQVQWIKFNPQGTLLVAGSFQHLWIWDTARGQRIALKPLPGARTTYPIFSPDGRYLATTAHRQTIIYEVGGGRIETFTPLQPEAPSMVQWTNWERTLLVPANEPVAEAVVDDATDFPTAPHMKLEVNQVAAGSPNYRLGLVTSRPRTTQCLSADGSRLGRRPDGGDLHLSRIAPGSETSQTLTDSRSFEVFHFSPRGDRIWGYGGNEVASWNVADGAQLTHWKAPGQTILSGVSGITSLAVSDHWTLAGGKDGMLYFLRSMDGTLESISPLNAGPIHSIAILPNEQFAVCGAETGIVQLVEVPSGRLLAQRNDHQESVPCIALANQGSLVATGSKDQTVRLWRLVRDQFDLLLTAKFPAAPRTLTFSSDGAKLAILLDDETTARVWHLDRLRIAFEDLGLPWNAATSALPEE